MEISEKYLKSLFTLSVKKLESKLLSKTFKKMKKIAG